LISTSKIFAQSKEEIESVKYIFNPVEKTEYKLNFNQENEYKLLLNIFFSGYKNFISPYDFQSCSFYPSCSVYAVESIEKKGFIIGILNAADRLTRCNGLSPELYGKYQNGKYLFDPIE
jgi:putative membrane protein insertion efficiency factor